jgi:hypothetical protein
MWTGVGHETTEEHGHDTAVHETGLTTTRVTHDGHAVMVSKFQQDIVNLSFTAKEKVALVHRKWT